MASTTRWSCAAIAIVLSLLLSPPASGQIQNGPWGAIYLSTLNEPYTEDFNSLPNDAYALFVRVAHSAGLRSISAGTPIKLWEA